MLLKKSNLFEAMGLRYFGPVDGHDIHHLIKILRDLKNIPGPKVLHCITVKGKGFKEAEINQTIWHAPGKFNKVTGERIILTFRPNFRMFLETQSQSWRRAIPRSSESPLLCLPAVH